MPEPNRAPWLVEPALAEATVARLIAEDAALDLSCHACRHHALWQAGELRRRFRKRPALTIAQLAPRLRCGRCRSLWIEVVRRRC